MEQGDLQALLTFPAADIRPRFSALIEAAHRRDVVSLLAGKADQCKRGMIFFKWYGRNLDTSVDVPEFHERYKSIRTIGISIFNKKQHTSKHYGLLRVTLRVLYNINHIESPDVFIRVGRHTHYWRDEKLFIFDDTLQHQSVNGSDEPRYCMFVDILRPRPSSRGLMRRHPLVRAPGGRADQRLLLQAVDVL